MARALLRRNSLVVMDEATSSVDFTTDAKIQKAIREEFTDSLPVSIPFYAVAELHSPLLDHSRSYDHRLNTIIDYDRLVVLDHGRVVEFDTPYTLIRKENGVLRKFNLLKSGSLARTGTAAGHLCSRIDSLARLLRDNVQHPRLVPTQSNGIGTGFSEPQTGVTGGVHRKVDNRIAPEPPNRFR
ncbi:hypothetical protein B0H13DRAFT_1917903 [Mycena leptocephala]|nr:hypothetical protein B0H13DRAFT_1917903 [Mycena leptocephala]